MTNKKQLTIGDLVAHLNTLNQNLLVFIDIGEYGIFQMASVPKIVKDFEADYSEKFMVHEYKTINEGLIL